MSAPSSFSRSQAAYRFRQWTQFWTSGVLLAVLPGSLLAQTAAPLAQAPVSAQTSSQASAQDKQVRNSDRRRAAKLYLEASKLFQAERFEDAMRSYQQAAKLDPSNADYPLAALLARSHAVTALVQTAAKARLLSNAAGARAALAHAAELDPTNALVRQHMSELGDDAIAGESQPLYEKGAATAGAADLLSPTSGAHSFHLHTDQRQLLQQVFHAYGIEVTVDDSVRPTLVRLDVDDVGFETAAQMVELVTGCFFVPLDAHHVLAARDTHALREQFTRQEMETVYLTGLSATELADVAALAKNVFSIQQAVAEPTAGTVTLRGPAKTLAAFNATMRELLDGRNQVMLDVDLIQIAHTKQRNTGVQPTQAVSAFNVYTEEQSILNSNQSLVQEIVSSGLAAKGDTLAILGILVASGQVSSSLFSSGFALFGGGLTESALSPGSVTANLSINSSDSRELDKMQLRLGDGEAGTLRLGSRYPIQTSSYSSLSSSSSSIAGLTSAGTSSSLSSLLSSVSSSSSNVPQVEYQDLGLTLKATPKVMRDNLVALSIDMKIDALSGSSLNGNPILNNRAYSGVVTLRQGEGVAVASELDKSESRAVSGTPGFSEIPGLNDITDKDTQKDYATLLIIISPHVIRATQAAGHTPMMRIEPGESTH